MIIWQGWGFLVAVIAFACLLATEYLTELAFNDDQFYQDHGWPKMLALSVAAMVLWPIAAYVRRSTARVLLDPETGEEVIVGGNHSFFFIPMIYWVPLLAIIGLLAGIFDKQ